LSAALYTPHQSGNTLGEVLDLRPEDWR